MGTLKITYEMVYLFLFFLIKLDLHLNTRMAKRTVKVFTLRQMDIYTKVSTKMTIIMATVFRFLRMGANTKGSLRMVNFMVKVS